MRLEQNATGLCATAQTRQFWWRRTSTRKDFPNQIRTAAILLAHLVDFAISQLIKKKKLTNFVCPFTMVGELNL